MPEFFTVATASAAVKIGASLYANKGVIRKQVDRIINRVVDGTLNIIVFGPSGVGKTTLAHCLGIHELKNFEYDMSLGIDEYKLKGTRPGILTVAPGHERARKQWWGQLFGRVAKGGVNGIINVVASGYHSIGGKESYQKSSFFKNGMTPSEFVEAHVAGMKEVELEIMRDLTARIMYAPDELWMLTLVTKQDLWWPDRDGVEAHYAEGQYNDMIEEIVKYRGLQNFHHEYRSVSLVPVNFRTGADEILAETAQGYDQTLIDTNMFETLKALDSFGGAKGAFE